MKKIIVIDSSGRFCLTLIKDIKKALDIPVTQLSNIDDIKTITVELFDLIIFSTSQESISDIKKLLTYKTPILLISSYKEPLNFDYTHYPYIVDLILKSENERNEHIIDKLKILHFVYEKKVLIVDDSKVALDVISKVITSLYPGINLIQAVNGEIALQTVMQNPDIKIILTDYEMPQMNGLELIKQIRERFTFDDKIIIAVSANTSKETSSTLLKGGANDFLHKPFNKEELKCRIDNNLKMALLIENVKELAYKDQLTNIYNRRYFCEMARKAFASKKRKHIDMSLIMLDVDHFKKINDTYGHQSGDLVLKEVANAIKDSLRDSDILARYGGEEFIILLMGCGAKNAFLIAENKIRKNIAALTVIDEQNKSIRFTISGGVSDQGNTLDEMIANADEMLYKAKRVRNKIEAMFKPKA